MPDDLPIEPPATGDPAPTPPPPAPEPPPPMDPATLGDAGKRALDAERAARRALESRLKELEPLADEARKQAEARKTAEQKLAEKLAAATAEAAGATTELQRLQVALDEVPPGTDPATVRSIARRLQGSTKEELEADAAELVAMILPASAPPPAGNGLRTPVENLRPGALPTTPQPSLADQIAAAEAAGEHRLAMGLKSQLVQQLRANQP